MVELHNPHSVLAALTARPTDIEIVRLPSNNNSSGWDEIAKNAAEQGIKVTRKGFGSKNREGRSGGGSAIVRERKPIKLEQLFQQPGERSIWLAFDGIQDPHNIGAIVRTAAFFGVKGVITTSNRSAPLNSVAYYVASGCMELVPFSVQSNLSQALKFAKTIGLWIMGSAEQADQSIDSIPKDRPWILVLGGENRGLRRIISEHCDVTCRVTPHGSLGSLNVSVATGILIEKLIQP